MSEPQKKHPVYEYEPAEDWPEKPKRKPGEIFQEILGFTDEDLEANQAGYITKEQQKHLLNARDLWLIGTLVTGGFLVVFIFTVGLNVGELGLGIVFAYLGYRWLTYNIDLYEDSVRAIEGQVTVKRRSGYWELTIRGRTFEINRLGSLEFMNGEFYRIYYSPQTRRILSAEWLRE